jgi:ATP-dependent DNA helicase DinG
MTSIDEVFAPAGLLSARLPGYTYREPQREMAELIWEALESGGHAIIEAGTGVGKTFAYLVPVLLSGQRTILSTGTKTLQDQLFAKDLPLLGRAIGRPVDVVVLKGRNNYLCWHRLEIARGDSSVNIDTRRLIEALHSWGRTHATGDLSELHDLEADFATRSRVTSTTDNCIGNQCEHYEECFVVAARRKALAATIVIVNHHLLLADLALKETGFGDLLGSAEVVVVDEAHLLPEIAQQFFGVSVSTREADRLIRDTILELRAHDPDVASLVASNDYTARLLATLNDEVVGRVPWRDVPSEIIDAFRACASGMREVIEMTAAAGDIPAGLARCRERLAEHIARTDEIIGDDTGDSLRWLERSGRSIALHRTPLEAGEQLAAKVSAHGGNWLFTSATLAVADRFDHFCQRVGFTAATTAVLASPFDYAENARIYVPETLPDPGDPSHTVQLMQHVWPIVNAAGGGAFLLFTSHRALQAASDYLEGHAAPGPVLVQGSAARGELLDAFRASGRAVLLGTGSFWQGVDVRGPALRIVVIDKLPFAAPNDPYVEASTEAVRRRGGNAFMDFQLPQAVIALKQGVGRLIRDYSDRGLIVLGDPRLRSRRYGRVFLDSLPPAPMLSGFDEALAFATSLMPQASLKAAAHPA